MGAPRQIAVVGGGVIGLCVAYSAAQCGCHVTVIDRGAADARDGCSFGNMGMIVPSHFVPLAAPGMIGPALKCLGNPRAPFYIAPRFDWELVRWGWRFMRAANARRVSRAMPMLRDLHLASRKWFVEWSRLPGADFGLVQRGLLMLCKTQRALDHEAEIAATARTLGIRADVLDGAGIAALEPDTRIDVIGAVHFPEDCHIDPARFMEFLRAQLVRYGVVFVHEAEVSDFLRSRSGHVDALETTRGEVAAHEFVVCGGAWSPGIIRSLGLRLSMQPGKGYSLTLPAPPVLPRVCAILTEARVAMTPIGSAVRFGGTMELAGLDRRIDPRRVDGIIEAATSYYPDFTPEHFKSVHAWCGLRPCSPDGLPYVGRLKNFDNVLIATGHGMLGLSTGPATAQLIGEMVNPFYPRFLDLELLSPHR
jgi:D-amino-acid dehydrogenase